MKERVKGLISGIIIGIMIATTTVIASTGIVKKDLHYNDIKITMNGKEVRPTDANGNYVEPFIIDGTTYLPVRGVANALDLGVEWDADTKTVQLHEKSEIDLFLENYGDSLNDYIENYAAENGLTFDITSSTDGKSIILDINVEEFDNLTEAEKKEIQNYFDETLEDLREPFKLVKTALPQLEKAVFNIRDKDGDFIAKIEISE